MKQYNTPPLPFQGNKRNFLTEYRKIIAHIPEQHFTVVDVFGGSGLLSRAAKDTRPSARVIYNDFDDFRGRLEKIPFTNRIVGELRQLVKGVCDEKNIDYLKPAIAAIFDKYEKEEALDYITLSKQLLFSGKYKKNRAEFFKNTFYNSISKNSYNADGYLDGLEIIQMDFKKVFEKYKNVNNVIFVCDPPYLSTDLATYTKISSYGYGGLRLTADLLCLLYETGAPFILFSSEKSQIGTLNDLLKRIANIDILAGTKIKKRKNSVNYNSEYCEFMIYNLRSTQFCLEFD